MLNKIVDSTLKNQYVPFTYHTMAFKYQATSNKYHTLPNKYHAASNEIAIRALKVPFGAFAAGVTRLEYDEWMYQKEVFLPCNDICLTARDMCYTPCDICLTPRDIWKARYHKK